MSIRKQYDEALSELNQALSEMGQAAADAIENAMEALAATDAEAAAQIIKDDNQINEMEHDIEHRCMVLLLRQQPVAGDLRHISAALKVITDFERIGDHAADISEIMPHLFASRKAGDPAISEAIRMGQKAHKMVQDGMAAFLGEDMNAAQKVIAADPTQVDAALDLLMVIKYLERIGDHAVNLAEWVQFTRTGLYKNENLF